MSPLRFRSRHCHDSASDSAPTFLPAAGPPEGNTLASRHALAHHVYPGPVSHLYRTPAWPNRDDPEFVNAVARLTTPLGPKELLAVLHAVEMSFGRKRSNKNAPRTLDLDILDYDGRVEQGPPELPHPRMADRSFVLVPLRDIVPSWRHPVSGASLDDLIAALGQEADAPRRIA